MDKLLRTSLHIYVDISDFFVLKTLVWEHIGSSFKDGSPLLMRGELSKESPNIPRDGGFIGKLNFVLI